MNLGTPLVSQAGAAVAGFGLTALLVEPARLVAMRYGLTDRPGGHKAHPAATPYLGGAAIAIGTLIPAVAVAGGHGRTLWIVAGAALAAAALGLADDLRGLGTRPRLAVEALLAGAVVVGGGRLHVAGPVWLDMALTVCWIVVLTNSFNLLDNVDGALATVACATALPLAVLLAVGGQPRLAGLLVCLSAACGGYLLHNAPPARIFMGDAGSLFIGLIIAGGTTWLPAGPDPYGHAAVLLLFVFPAVADTALVVVSRCLHGRSIFQGGTDHLTHRLRRLGLGGNAVLATLLLVTGGCGLLASFVSGSLVSGRLVLSGVGLAAVLLVGLLLLIPGYPVTAVRTIAVHTGSGWRTPHDSRG